MFLDSYKLKWKLKDDEGLVWWECHTEMSMTDIQALMGINVWLVLEAKIDLMV